MFHVVVFFSNNFNKYDLNKYTNFYFSDKIEY